MKSQLYPPHPILGDHIACLWTSEHIAQASGKIVELLPDSYIELVFSFGGKAQILRGDGEVALPRSYLVGLLSEPCRLQLQGTLKSIAARFYVWGFRSLLGQNLDGSHATISELTAEFQLLAGELEPSILSDDIEGAITILHDYLIEHALKAKFEKTVLQSATQKLLDESGRISIRELADQIQLSRRQLERLFQTSLGESPKAIAQLMRFEKARNWLCREPDTDFASLARECGYADQAHLNREFKKFCNRTPRQFALEMLATHEWLRSAGVAFIQDN